MPEMRNVLRLVVIFIVGMVGLAGCKPKPPETAPSVSGTWVATEKGAMGEMEFVLRLEQAADGKVSGFVSSPFSDMQVQEGRVNADDIELTLDIEFFGKLDRRTVKGKILADSLEFDAAQFMPKMEGMPPGGGTGPAPAAGSGPAAGAEPNSAGQPAPGAPAGPPGAPPGAGPGPGAPPAAGAGPGPGAGMPPMFGANAKLIFKKGEPKPSYRAGPVDYKALPQIELPALADVSSNGLARTPPMGWNSWNKFHADIDDKTVREIADAMVSTGMLEAGYQYVIIDDGWAGTRDEQGVLQPNAKFPDMKALADYVHSKGLKLGIYSSPGPRTCGRYEGSYGQEELDAKTWAEWGIDYLKYDWCSASSIWEDKDMQAVYQRMGSALAATGRPIVYSLCQYGNAQVETWGAQVGGNLWRTTFDISDNWNSMVGNISSQEPRAPSAGPGGWNDPDMLEVGNGGMTPDEYRVHFSLWAIAAAPLIAGHDVRNMDEATRAILLNKEVIAVNQDAKGIQGRRVLVQGDIEYWLRELDGSQYALAIVNKGGAQVDASVSWADLKLPGNLQGRDLWLARDLGTLAQGYEGAVPSHSVVMLKLRK